MNQKLLLIILLFIGFEFPMLLQAQIKKTNLKKKQRLILLKLQKILLKSFTSRKG